MIFLLPAVCVTCLSFSAHQHGGPAAGPAYRQDTIPGKTGNIDDQLKQLDKAMEKLDLQLQQKDWNKMQAELEASCSH